MRNDIYDPKSKDKPKTAQMIKGTNYLITRVHNWEKHYDLELMDIETGNESNMRVIR